MRLSFESECTAVRVGIAHAIPVFSYRRRTPMMHFKVFYIRSPSSPLVVSVFGRSVCCRSVAIVVVVGRSFGRSSSSVSPVVFCRPRSRVIVCRCCCRRCRRRRSSLSSLSFVVVCRPRRRVIVCRCCFRLCRRRRAYRRLLREGKFGDHAVRLRYEQREFHNCRFICSLMMWKRSCVFICV